MSRRRARGDAYGGALGTPQDTLGATPNAIPVAGSRATSGATPRANIEGSLCDHPVRKLFDLCQRQRVTGALQLVSWGRTGRVELRAGRITAAAYGTLEGTGAVSELLTLRDGMFELRQELPSLPAGRDAGPVGLSAIAEQCRQRTLSCRIQALSRGQRAVVTYRAGELERVEIDGAAPAVGDIANTAALAPFERGQIQIEALPISLHERAVTAPAPIVTPRPEPPPVSRPVPAVPARRAVAPPARPSAADGLAARSSVASGEIAARSSVASGEITARPAVRREPPPLPRVPSHPRPKAALAGGLQPWLPDPSTSGAAASWREAPPGRRDLALPAILAVLALSLLLIIGFVALQQ
jgi:Domain of unknown function (DUF4388)